MEQLDELARADPRVSARSQPEGEAQGCRGSCRNGLGAVDLGLLLDSRANLQAADRDALLRRRRRGEIKLGRVEQPARYFRVPRIVLWRFRAHGFSLSRMGSRAI